MRTEAAALAIAAALAVSAAASTARAHPPGEHLELGQFAEGTFIGPSGGVRLELIARPGRRGTASRLRLGVGALAGPEFNYAPVALGYRAVWRTEKIVQPLLGTGFEYQLRWNRDATANQIAWYAEVGLLFRVAETVSVGAIAGIDWTIWGGPGAGITARLGVVWRQPGSATR